MQDKLLALEKTFLLALEGYIGAIGADILEHKMVAPPLEQSMIPRSTAIANDDLATDIATDEHARPMSVEQLHVMTIAHAKPQVAFLC